MFFVAVTLTLTRWPWVYKLDLDILYRIVQACQNIHVNGFPKLQPEQNRQTDRRDRTYYNAASASAKNSRLFMQYSSAIDVYHHALYTRTAVSHLHSNKLSDEEVIGVANYGALGARAPMFEKTCATTQKRKKSCFLGFSKKR